MGNHCCGAVDREGHGVNVDGAVPKVDGRRAGRRQIGGPKVGREIVVRGVVGRKLTSAIVSGEYGVRCGENRKN